MKSIYILLTNSNTCISKLIKLATNDPYTHVSMSFDDKLAELYSFSRKQMQYPLPAGLTKEQLHTGFFAKYDSIKCTLYSLEVEDEVYYAAKAEVERMIEKVDVYRYNILGLALCRLNISYKRKKHYFCSQFVSEILINSNAIELPKPAPLMRPSDYIKIPELSCLFEGQIKGLQANWQYAIDGI